MRRRGSWFEGRTQSAQGDLRSAVSAGSETRAERERSAVSAGSETRTERERSEISAGSETRAERRRYAWYLWSLLALGLWFGAPGWSVACPFCTPVSRTLTEEIETMDAVVIARLAAPLATAAKDRPATRARFEIQELLKGGDLLAKGKTLETTYPLGAKAGDRFLIMGVDPPQIAWATPTPVSDRALAYLRKLKTLPATAERLAFFQDYLEDRDVLLARDAYDEFAKAPYKDVQDLRDKMDHDKLVGWIQMPDVPASRRRLYLVMLSVCGGPANLPLLEQLLRSDDRKAKVGLDALIGCYLMLAREGGLPLIEELYLRNAKADYADTYAAITALRFLGTETDSVRETRLLKALHLILERPPLADLVIADLARWEDWSALERLVRLFKEADEKSNWVRVPIVQYLRACPLPEAKVRLQDLEKVDPESVKRAQAFFPVGPARGGK